MTGDYHRFIGVLHDPAGIDMIHVGMSNEDITLAEVKAVARGEFGIFAVDELPTANDCRNAAARLLKLADSLDFMLKPTLRSVQSAVENFSKKKAAE